MKQWGNWVITPLSMKYSNSVIIIGCGVSGLSCGIRLLEAGFDGVKIVARELPPHTTSNRAAAVWYPYKAYPEDKVLGWSATTFQVFNLCESQPLPTKPAS
jgi:D-amino-acid oxidase